MLSGLCRAAARCSASAVRSPPRVLLCWGGRCISSVATWKPFVQPLLNAPAPRRSKEDIDGYDETEPLPPPTAEEGQLLQRVNQGDLPAVKLLVVSPQLVDQLSLHTISVVLEAFDKADDVASMAALVRTMPRPSSPQFLQLIAAQLGRGMFDDAAESLKSMLRECRLPLDSKFVSGVLAAVATSPVTAPEDTRVMKIIRDQRPSMSQPYFFHRLRSLLARPPNVDVCQKFLRGMEFLDVRIYADMYTLLIESFARVHNLSAIELYYDKSVEIDAKLDLRAYKALSREWANAKNPRVARLTELVDRLARQGYGALSTEIANHLMHAYVKVGSYDKCLDVFDNQKGRLDSMSFVVALRACGMAGHRDRLWDLLMDYHERYRDATSKVYAAALSGYSRMWDSVAILHLLDFLEHQRVPITTSMSMSLLGPHFTSAVSANARKISHQLGTSRSTAGPGYDHNETERVLSESEVRMLKRFAATLGKRTATRAAGPPAPLTPTEAPAPLSRFPRPGQALVPPPSANQPPGQFLGRSPAQLEQLGGPAAAVADAAIPRPPGPPANTPVQSGEIDPTNTTVFVGGIEPACTTELLRSCFEKFGAVAHVRKLPGKDFAFVEYASHDGALNCIKQTGGSAIVGSATVRIKWGRPGTSTPIVAAVNLNPFTLAEPARATGASSQAARATGGASQAATDPTITTVYVGDIDPSCTIELLRSCFEKFGEIADINIVFKRLAFVDYVSHDSALNCIKQTGGSAIVGSATVRIKWGRPGTSTPKVAAVNLNAPSLGEPPRPTGDGSISADASATHEESLQSSQSNAS
eukprot:TRINITY_DN3877_c0_g1_i3.p1 TRINITY_DN3877_c0_g1~~TRINITY_DN3877_c0_g1_i3.p1  ORF type:complete len:813 (+),score=267.36 TRINITY_DN3877_c0_g1_i3:612-3050(+)